MKFKKSLHRHEMKETKEVACLFFFAFSQIIIFIARTCNFDAVLNVCDYLMAFNDKRRFRYYQLN